MRGTECDDIGRFLAKYVKWAAAGTHCRSAIRLTERRRTQIQFAGFRLAR